VHLCPTICYMRGCTYTRCCTSSLANKTQQHLATTHSRWWPCGWWPRAARSECGRRRRGTAWTGFAANVDSRIGIADQPGSGHRNDAHALPTRSSSMTAIYGNPNQATALGHQLLQAGALLTDIKGDLSATHWRQPPRARYWLADLHLSTPDAAPSAVLDAS
jgi:hypothetical protein